MIATTTGVCLVVMASRILPRVAAKSLGTSTEYCRILDYIQNGLRPSRSTDDVTQIIKRIQEDVSVRRETDDVLEENPIEAEATIFALRKTYPRGSRPLVWDALRKFSVKGKMQNCLMDLHEATAYNIKAREGRSSEWTPQRGCPTSPRAMQHLLPMRPESRPRSQKQPGPEHTQRSRDEMEVEYLSRRTTQRQKANGSIVNTKREPFISPSLPKTPSL